MITYYDSPFGTIELRANTNALTHLYFVSDEEKINKTHTTPKNSILKTAVKQLIQYFSGDRHTFNLPLEPQGTPFQQKVWQTLQTINYGETQSYAWLAKMINNPKAVRAVGRANGANPISIIIPCHRIIGANGTLTGYAGGLALKEQLLNLEGAKFIAAHQKG